MLYKVKEGIIKERISRLSLFFVALGFTLALFLTTSLALFSTASATSHGQSFEFTQQELDDNWEADRTFPSGGVGSVSAFGRDNVAQLSIDTNNITDGSTFFRTEGIKTTPVQNFGNTVQSDLYVNPDWQDKPVRAGLWVVGDDGTGDRDELFGIIEFANNDAHEGWRVWDPSTGWVNTAADFEYGEWHTLTIELDTDAEEYVYYVDGVQIGTALGGENFIREVFLNSYNYGLEGGDNYQAHWHGGLNPVEKGECKKGGFETFGFRNQGQCIRFVNTGQDSR